MEQLFNRSGDLEIVASGNSSHEDFDFLAGQWTVHNRKLKSRLSGWSEWTEFEAQVECRLILNGFGNTDSFQTTVEGRPWEGMSLRLFNPKTRLWSIYWANCETVVLDVGPINTPKSGVFIGPTARRSSWTFHKSARLKTQSAASMRETLTKKKKLSCSSAGMRLIPALPSGLRPSRPITGSPGNGTGI